MRRGVGFCRNVGTRETGGCESYAKGVFLLNHGEIFQCAICREIGTVVSERGIHSLKHAEPFKEVRVEFNYDPLSCRFREIAIVRDESIKGTGSVYTLISPLIKTDKRALKVAEAILANLQSYPGAVSDEIPGTAETIISFDQDFPSFVRTMQELGEDWQKSTLAQQAERT